MANFSKNFKKVIDNAKKSSDNNLVQPPNLLKGVFMTTDSQAYKILDYLNVRPNPEFINLDNVVNNPDAEYNLTSYTENIIKQSEIEATRLVSNITRSEHLLLALVRAKSLENVSVSDIEMVIQSFKENGTEKEKVNVGNGESKGENSLLEKYCTNLNKLAKEGKLDPVIGRDRETLRIEQILSRKKKNNPVIIGESGVGKTALAEKLAQKIIAGDVSEYLREKQILSLEMNNIVAGTKYRGEFEERMKKIVDELSKSNDYILFIDEIHTIIGAGGASGALDAANILKPALSRGLFSIIGSTTLSEYRNIEKDGALDRRFQKVIIEEPTLSETKLILYNSKFRYEDFHGVEYSDEIIDECLSLSARYITDRRFPDKAIDLLDEVGSYVKIKNFKNSPEIIKLEEDLENSIALKMQYVQEQEFEKAAEEREIEKGIKEKINELKNSLKEKKIPVLKEDVYIVISTITNIPTKSVSENDIEKFISLEKNIKSNLVGQDDAITKITKSLIRNKAGLGNSKKPIGSFIFLGSTGIGKTYLAKLLAKNLFNDEDAMIRIDMSEYMEKQSVSRLIGASPGYVGYEEGGQLTEKIRRKPYSIILLDEIEKAHPDVFNILLQVLDDGKLTDSQGRTVNFKNTVVIMTSNVGSKKAAQFGTGIGFDNSSNDINTRTIDIIEKEVKKLFPPEFLNRVDDIISFNSLSKDNIKNIINIELNNFSNLLLDTNDIKITFDDDVKNFIFDKGYDEKMGARPIKRTIQKYVEDEVSLIVLKKDAKSGDTIKATYNSDNDNINYDIINNNQMQFGNTECVEK